MNSSELKNQITSRLKAAFEKGASLHQPSFFGSEWDYVKDCLDSGWVSSAGPYVDRFENELAERVGVRNAIAVVNGTLALHTCLQLAGVKANDEVMLPSLTFVATANAVAYLHAVPHFVDSEEATLGVDPKSLRRHLEKIAVMKHGECFNQVTGRRVKAVLGVHVFGHPFKADQVRDLCEEYGMALIEDAAESLGSYYQGKHTGSFGLLSALSFNGNKILTTGGGGAVLTNDDALAKRAKHITTTAKRAHPWEFFHDEIGYNYRMPNINASLGCAQLECLDDFLQKKNGR